MYPTFPWPEQAIVLFGSVVACDASCRGTHLENEMGVRHLIGSIAEQCRVRSHGGTSNMAALAATGMSPARFAMVSLLTLAILAGSAFDVIRNREHWPFSPYPMFSKVDDSRGYRTLRLYGVARDGGELPLTDFAYLEPFDRCRLVSALETLRAEQRLPAALADVYARYERRRTAGRHGGPPLSAVRLYQLRWALDADARNAQHPDVRELLYEHRPDR